MSLIKEWTFGTHSARWEEPDLLRLTWKGPTRVEDVDKVLAILAEVAAERPIFVISDVSRSTIDKAAREHMSQSLRAEWFHGLIYVGADALQRAITKAIVIALYFTGKWRVDVEFAATEEEAMHIVSRVRRARGADAPARTGNVSMGLQGPQAMA
jgi:tRNA uridine 5-carbamoylmethylation protein Kti12